MTISCDFIFFANIGSVSLMFAASSLNLTQHNENCAYTAVQASYVLQNSAAIRAALFLICIEICAIVTNYVCVNIVVSVL